MYLKDNIDSILIIIHVTVIICVMTTLCVGDSHVNRLRSYIGTRIPSSSVFDISGLMNVKYYVISGTLISSDRHWSLITGAVRQHQPQYVSV